MTALQSVQMDVMPNESTLTRGVYHCLASVDTGHAFCKLPPEQVRAQFSIINIPPQNKTYKLFLHCSKKRFCSEKNGQS